MSILISDKQPTAVPRKGGLLPGVTRALVLSLALSLGLGAIVVTPGGVAHAASLGSEAGRRQYDIPGGSLDQVLNRFADAAGIQVLADAELTAGKTASGLKGAYSIEEGLRMLLAQYGIEARRGSQANIWSLRRAPVWRQPGAVSALTPVRVRGSAPEEKIFETPNSDMVITRKQIDRLPPRNLSDIFEDSPGVYAKNARGTTILQVNIRGIEGDSRNSMMIDGARQNFQRTSQFGSFHGIYMDPALVRQVDIAKGVGTGVGTVGAIGGAVNFRTLEFEDVVTNPDAAVGGTASVSRGSNAIDFTGSVGLGARLGEDVDIVGAFSRRRIGDFRVGRRGYPGDDALIGTKDGQQDSTAGLMKLRWRITPDQDLKLGYVGFRSERYGTTYQRSGTIEQSRNNVKTSTIKADYAWHPSDSSLVDLNASLYYTRTDMDTFTAGTGVESLFQTNTVGGSLSNTSTWEKATHTWKLHYGSEFFHDWTNPRAYNVYAGKEADSLYSRTTPKGKRTLASLFTEGTWSHASGFEVTAGLRYDYYQVSGAGRYAVDYRKNQPGQEPEWTQIAVDFDLKRHERFLAPRIVLSYSPPAWEGVQFFAGWNQGSRPPSITESLISVPDGPYELLPNPGLDPEHARHFELGVNLRKMNLLIPHDRFGAKLSVFHTKMTDSIVMADVMGPTTIGNYADGCRRNNNWRQCEDPKGFTNYYGDVVYRGLELHLSYDAGVAFGSLNISRMLFRDVNGQLNYYPLGSMVGYPPPARPYGDVIWGGLGMKNLPALSGNLNLGVRLFDRRVTLGWRMRYQRAGDYALVSGSAGNVSDWTTHDVWANVVLHKNVELRLAVNNLRDQWYGETGTEGLQFAPGRTAMATLQIKF